jgi:hypothetical protein
MKELQWYIIKGILYVETHGCTCISMKDVEMFTITCSGLINLETSVIYQMEQNKAIFLLFSESHAMSVHGASKQAPLLAQFFN